MRRGRPPYPDLLTPREREVLDLIREGLTNQQIAERLGISLPGARYHVSEILSKLGVGSRHEAAEVSSAGVASRPRWAIGLLAVPLNKLASLGMANGVAAGALLVASAGVLLLALGVFAMNHRHSDNGGVVPATCNLINETAACPLGKVAYIQNGDVWVKQLPDGTPRRLTIDGQDSTPRWSHSGDWLTLERQAPGSPPANQYWVMRSDGTASRQIDAATDSLAWSPVNDSLVYVSTAGDLVLEQADGFQSSILLQRTAKGPSAGGDETLADPLWSPDGKTIALSRWTRQGTLYSGLWRVDVAGGGARELVGDKTQAGTKPGPGGEMRPAEWSADGRQIYFWRSPVFSASIEADGVALWAVSSTGADAHEAGIMSLLYPDYVDAAGPTVAVADGGDRMSWTRKTISIIDASGAEHDVSAPGIAAIEPALSPDGVQVAYVAAPDEPGVTGGDPSFSAMAQRRVWLVNAGGSSARPLAPDSTNREEAPQWSRDGSQVVFVRVEGENNASLWSAPVAGGAAIKLTSISVLPGPASSGPPFLPDGHWWGYYGHYDWSQMFDWWQP
ncbi:MAG TPA: LuxR C-terminal-related transcriptional regulator [Dehalococcoidia bacterium]|nr:LuxR C-terminal-related transcriptional regulator [Dehalococcoidia bacterium]